ncbi:hypothetical protein B0F90DRAFT_1725534 [Multifurca ochricompacta]|uniref:Uncharacterized protein n=1 Tax=Multifurca ochricompacta TaxID=376703 RepID=A0AAD4M5F2_9AGAM|nr:hypothetical protein B0F90DRAFT_1725534 [Multifurca ochricompacta]
MALAHYPSFLERPLPIQSKHPYLLSVSSKQVLPMSNPYSWNKSASGLEPWDAPQSSWTIDSSYSTLQSAVQPNEPTPSQVASGTHPLQHPLAESSRCDPSLTSRLSLAELGHLSSHSPSLRGLDPMFRFPPTGSDLLYTMDDSLDVDHHTLITNKSTPIVKEEQEDGSVTAAFVFESSPSTPGLANEGLRETQVPLRATQATKAMRKMMSVFRLNPFAVQGSTPTVEEAGPLEEEGRLFEFQLRLGDSSPPSSPPVRSASTLPDSRTTSPGNDWMGRARPPSEVGNRRTSETPGSINDSGWGYQLPTELSPPFTLSPGVVECREPGGDASATRTGIGSRIVQTPNPRYDSYSQSTQSPSGRGGAHNCAYGYGTIAEQGLRRYSGVQRDPSRPTTPGPSYANVYEDQTAMSTSAVMSGESFIATSHDPRRPRRWDGSRHHGHGSFS